ncbi:glyoxalase superfamily protein [Tropicimonas sp. IMCC34043]|uniref:glyoxalase superfamily protein n=1 Tax=Tropicimonas sp. IMCC34043 TaxID=2248760 RepID=UPI000E265707|nr:glyoxalase superfamily protein [Tropicimonas sp. IMCC34043]
MTPNDTPALPSVETLKAQARRLRETLTEAGSAMSHSRSLEVLARQLGYRDWNTLRAAADRPALPEPTARPNRPLPPVQTGDRIAGRYLGQPFTGEVLGIAQMNGGSHYRITVQFDEPVDVVKFESFSSLRRRVNATIDTTGVSPQQTSDGAPHFRLENVL